MKKIFNTSLILGVAVLFFLAGYRVYTYRSKENLFYNGDAKLHSYIDGYNINGVLVDTANYRIIVEGVVLPHRETVQFLFYAHGYNWLREECAIELDTDLRSLQKAVSIFNWKLWDDLWQDKNDYNINYPEIFIKHNADTISPFGLVQSPDSLVFRDLIFWGSPYFDKVAFETPPGVDCTRCPMFEMETSFLREKFKRESGNSGYSVKTRYMPNPGERVKVVMDFSRIEQRENLNE